MKKHLYLLLLLSFCGKSTAQNATTQVQNLASKITAGVPTDSLKVRAIYNWITDNIEYDVPLLRKINRKSVEEFIELQQPEQVLASKKAVCMGYSILFKELCGSVGIKSQFVSGYCKNIDPETKRLNIPDMLHAWNAVKINNKWYLCDLTWSAGAVSEKDGRFIKERNEQFYLNANSQDFVKRHLPFDPIWQLSNEPITVKEFRLYPELPPNRMNPQKISFADSLRAFETQDAENQKINSYRRALQFDRSNDEAKAAIGYFYANKASKTMNDCQGLVMKFLNQNTEESYKVGLENKSKIFELFSNAEKEARWAKYYYTQIPSNSKFGQVADANKQNADQVLAVINQNRSNLGKYYEFLKTRKR